MANIKRNKQLIDERHQAVQRACLGGSERFERNMAGQRRHFLAGSMPEPPSERGALIANWHKQTMSPPFHGYGPMIAEGDYVVEEWESFIHGSDSTIYNNFYCLVQRIEDQQVVEVHEYVDSHHVWTILGRNPTWPELQPPTERREGPLDGVEIVREFDFDPRLLRDPMPSHNSRGSSSSGIVANKALIGSLHDAQVDGDEEAVSSFYAEDFQHFLAGERPFGWDHLPLEAIYRPLVDHIASPLTFKFGPMIAEGDRVVEEMESFARLDDGTVYNNWHCFLHKIRDGKIVETREYLDTHHIWVVLGRWADWAATPVPPLRKARRSNLPAVAACYQHRSPFLDLERWGGAMTDVWGTR
jgi:ketosteroid isomerase-like protein